MKRHRRLVGLAAAVLAAWTAATQAQVLLDQQQLGPPNVLEGLPEAGGRGEPRMDTPRPSVPAELVDPSLTLTPDQRVDPYRSPIGAPGVGLGEEAASDRAAGVDLTPDPATDKPEGDFRGVPRPDGGGRAAPARPRGDVFSRTLSGFAVVVALGFLVGGFLAVRRRRSSR